MSVQTIEIKRHKFIECYHHLLEPNDFDIEFVWGGRDSGKSQHVAQQLIHESLSLPYFRCVLIKKTFESIKDSQWQTIKDIAETWGIDDLFTFRLSPLEIENKKNNRFISRGCDNPAKLKSIRNPSHVWIEEGDQLTLEDFTAIVTTLRTDIGRVKIYFVFNPELPRGTTEKEQFWLYKHWFSHTNDVNFVAEKVMRGNKADVTIRYRSTNTTYKDNPYCPPERQAFHESLKDMNPAKYVPYTLGLWGSFYNDVPFFYAYNENKVLDFEPYTPDFDRYFDIGFDFNKTPTCAVIGQQDEQYNYHVFDVILADPSTMSGLSPLAAVCEQIRAKYFDTGLTINARVRVTGDASGRAGSADRQDAQTFYNTIKNVLQLNDGNFYVRKANLTHNASGEMINTALYKLGYHIHDCELLRSDIKKSYPDKDGSLNEAKKQFGLHILDAWRYLNDLWYGYSAYWMKNPKDIMDNIDKICLIQNT